MEEENGKWEALIRSKIYDFESETKPEDWDALSAKLNGGKTVRLIPVRKYILTATAAAAVIALLIIGGLKLFLDNNDQSKTQATVERPTPQIIENNSDDSENSTEPVVNQVDHSSAIAMNQVKKTVVRNLEIKEESPAKLPSDLQDEIVQVQAIANPDHPDENVLDVLPIINTEDVTIAESYLAAAPTETTRRRWGFGMGGGGYGIGSTTGANGVSTASRMLNEDEFMRHIATRSSSQSILDPVEGFENDNLVGKRKYLIPLSGGLGVSYYLSDRWTLSSGVVYTLLRSKESYYEADGISTWKQNLHFIGIPLSASYRIADWNRVRFYVTAGGMGELNVARQLKKTIQVENLESITNENKRMKEPLWSVNTRAGAEYPLWKFIHIYAETGVSYYFKNDSPIETIRSDKPFNVSLQAGFRFGF